MPATIAVGGQAQAVYQEWDGPNGSGNKVAPTGKVTYSSENTAVATVDPDSGMVTGVSTGTVVIDGVDDGTGIKAQDTLTVTAGGGGGGTAQSATLTLTAI